MAGTLGKLLVTLGLDSAEFTKGVTSATEQTSSLSSTLLSIGGAAATAGAVAGAAMVGIGVAGVKAFAGFQQGMSEVFTLLPGISGDAMTKMSGQVKDFAKEFGVLPEKEIPALYQALSSGVPPGNVFDFLEVAQKAAVGGVTELQTAVDGLTSVTNAYGPSVLSATQASDLMFTTVKLGKTNFEQLSASLFNVTPTAASLGVTFQDVSAAMASITLAGTPTSVATTELRAALVEASKGGTKLDGALKGLTGKSFPQLIASGQDIGTIFNHLRSSMPDQQFKDLFGSVEGLNAILAITGPNAKTFASNLDAMRNSTGATNAAYDVMNQTLTASMNKIKAAGAVFLITIGEKLAPAVGLFANMLVALLQSQGATDFINGLGVAIASTIQWLIDAGTVAVPAVTSAFITFGEALAPIIAYFQEVWASGDVLNAYLTSFPALLQPIVMIIGDYVNVLGDYFDTIVNVGAALLSGNFMGALTALEAGLQGAAGDLLTYYTDIGTTLASIGLYVAQQTLVWGQALVTWITPYIPIALAYLNTLIIQIQTWALAQVPIIEAAILQWGNAFVGWVTPYIPIALQYLQNLIIAVGAWITAQAVTLAGYFMVWATAGGDWVTPYITIALGYLQGLISAVGSWITGQVSTLSAEFAAWAVATYSWVVAAIPKFLDAWPTLLNGFLNWIGSAVGPILASFGLWLVGILQWIAKSGPPILAGLMAWGVQFTAWIAPQIPGMIAALGGILLAVITFVGETTGVLAVKLVEWGLAFIGWVAKNVLPALPGILLGIGNLIYTFITDVAKTVVALAAGIGQGIIDGIKNADWSALGTWISDQLAGMLKAGKAALGISSPSKVFADQVGQMIPAGIAVGIDAGADTMTSALTTLLGTATAGAKSVASSVGSTLTGGTLTAAGTAAGRAAIAGLAAGMLSAVGTAKSAAKSATDSITGSFKANLDIHSPSGVFADQIGVPMILGVVEGMNATMPKVLEWVRGNLGKKLAGYLTNAAAMVRGNLDIFTSLHDLEKLDPYQPLVDSTTALATAQDAAIATSSKLQDVTSQINALVAQNSTITDANQTLRNNQELTKLYQQQAQLMQDQATSQANLVQLGQAQASAQQASAQQQQAINQIALDAQKQYNDLAAQSQSMMGVDAKRALDFFNMRKSQIQELADLQKQRALATSADDQKFLDAQIALTKAAQAADTAAAQATVNVNVPGGTNDNSTQQITNIINQALKAAGYLTDVRVRTN